MSIIRIFVLGLLCLFLCTSGLGQSRKYSMRRAKLSLAPDKIAATAELITDTKKDFKPSEYEYFQSFSQSGLVLMSVNNVQALKYFEEARELFKKYHTG